MNYNEWLKYCNKYREYTADFETGKADILFDQMKEGNPDFIVRPKEFNIREALEFYGI